MPKVFISYSWDSNEHKTWVRALATRLRSDGVDVTLDHWHAVPGDQLPAFMESAIRESDYVLIVCTPKYKVKADRRSGGTGYEGDVITAETFTTGNHRKFIPILRDGTWLDAAPSLVRGKYYINLVGDPYPPTAYADLLSTLKNTRPKPPPVADIRPAPSNSLGSDASVDGEQHLPPAKLHRILDATVGTVCGLLLGVGAYTLLGLDLEDFGSFMGIVPLTLMSGVVAWISRRRPRHYLWLAIGTVTGVVLVAWLAMPTVRARLPPGSDQFAWRMAAGVGLAYGPILGVLAAYLALALRPGR